MGSENSDEAPGFARIGLAERTNRMQSALGVEPGALCFGGSPARKQGKQSVA